MSHVRLCFHSSWIIIFAFNVTGFTNPRGTYSFEDKFNTDLLETFFVLLVSLISFANESDRVSVFVFQLRPRTLTIGSEYTPSAQAWRFKAEELLVHCRKFIPAFWKQFLDDV